MSEKKSIVVLCGGQSAEHEISILSARNVVAALKLNQFDVSVIYLSQQGAWFLVDFDKDDVDAQEEKRVVLVPGNPKAPFVLAHNMSQSISVDCVIPMLHGTCGEDGSVQGLLDILNVPYVGSDVLGSTLCMQKHIAKRLLRFAGLPTTDWVRLDKNAMNQFDYHVISRELGTTFFIKPSALGSSVGISKVHNQQQYNAAVGNAFRYDNEVIAERFVDGREIECSVLGNDEPVASLPGELITTHEFYSYEAKYLDSNSLKIITPADLPEATVCTIQDLAIEAFKVLQCHGMARVDFFVTEEQEIFINEVNTIPGFTSLSMYPKNWEASGLPFAELLASLIQLSIARYRHQSELSHHYLGPLESSQDSLLLRKELE